MSGHDMLMFDRTTCIGLHDASVSLHRHSRGAKPPRFLVLVEIRAEDTSCVSRSLDPIEAAALAAQLEDTGLLALDFSALSVRVRFSAPDATRVAFFLRKAITLAGQALAGNFAPSDTTAVEPDA